MVGDVADRRRQREDDVEIGHREQLGLARGHPGASFRALALGTVPIAAAIVDDHCMGAVLTACHMPAEGGRAAARWRELVEAHVAAEDPMYKDECFSMVKFAQLSKKCRRKSCGGYDAGWV